MSIDKKLLKRLKILYVEDDAVIRTELSQLLSNFFATAYSDNEFLAEAIKLKIYEYIVKLIDIRQLLSLMNDLAYVLYKDFLIDQKNRELEKYKEVTDLNNIVTETDIHMKISKVNELCCSTSGYSKAELIGQDFKFLKHNDSYIKMYTEVLNNKSWQGHLK